MKYTNPLTIIFLYLLTISAFSQQTDSIKARKFAIGFSYSPDYSFRFLNGPSEEKSTIRYLDSIEMPKYNYSTGVNLIYFLSDKVQLSGGILYSDKGYETTEQNFAYPPWPARGSSLEPARVVYYFYYLDIPIKVSYRFTTKKLSFFASAGVSADITLSQSS